MIRKSIILLVSILLILSIFTFPVSAKSADNDNAGSPFQEIWAAITGINEEINDLHEQVNGIIDEQSLQEASPDSVIIQAQKDVVETTVSAGWVEIFEYRTAQGTTIKDVQAYCSDAAANARIDVRSNGSSVILAQPLSGGNTVSMPIIESNVDSSAIISVVCYTDQPDSFINNLTVSISFEVE